MGSFSWIFSLEQLVHLILYFSYYLFRPTTSRTETKLHKELRALPTASSLQQQPISMSASGFGADTGLLHGADWVFVASGNEYALCALFTHDNNNAKHLQAWFSSTSQAASLPEEGSYLLFMPRVEGMEGKKLLSKLLAGVWIAWTQGCCSSASCGLPCCTQLGAGGVRNPLGSAKQVSKHFTGMQGWGVGVGMLQTSTWKEGNPLVSQIGENVIVLHAIPAKE